MGFVSLKNLGLLRRLPHIMRYLEGCQVGFEHRAGMVAVSIRRKDRSGGIVVSLDSYDVPHFSGFRIPDECLPALVELGEDPQVHAWELTSADLILHRNGHRWTRSTMPCRLTPDIALDCSALSTDVNEVTRIVKRLGLIASKSGEAEGILLDAGEAMAASPAVAACIQFTAPSSGPVRIPATPEFYELIMRLGMGRVTFEDDGSTLSATSGQYMVWRKQPLPSTQFPRIHSAVPAARHFGRLMTDQLGNRAGCDVGEKVSQARLELIGNDLHYHTAKFGFEFLLTGPAVTGPAAHVEVPVNDLYRACVAIGGTTMAVIDIGGSGQPVVLRNESGWAMLAAAGKEELA